ncbi:hypothetical protein ACIO93_34935 [Streptomyces sp. NPDC087903]|uniref:Rv1733c family protein n=1 Tax=Streptomyces sp. NPDC087903 TaxID=3365819 RepID=UPI00380588DD
MSAQGSPYAAGPPSGRDRKTPKGANSLRRMSDRLECWLRRALMVVLVFGLPVVSVGAGLTAYRASLDTVRAQTADRHQVTARLTSSISSANGWAERTAQVRWTDTNGIMRTGAARVKPGTPKGATVRVWVARGGTVTGPPTTTLNATTSGWMVGGMAAFGVAAGCCAAWAGLRLVLDRRRYAQWDADWNQVEPQWSARFHP